ncbi:MAG: ribosome-associated translation inhibitor RaiA [Thermoleophilia bacterium]|nr:ribosome-associated translation inhibitor RaiA [Thermoleophilia bacterium]
MQLKLTARHEHLDDGVRQYAERKFSKLDRRLNDLALVEVTFSQEHNPSISADHTVDAVIHTKGPSLVARESAATYEAAIDRLIDKLERQVERYRDKRTLEQRRRSKHPTADSEVGVAEAPHNESAA